MDRIRFRLGDTVVLPVEAAELSDEEILALLASNDDNEGAATLAAANALYARYTRLTSTSVGDTSIQFGEIAASWRRLITDLERDISASGGAALPYAGGISIADKQSREANTDRVEPAFSREGVGSMGRVFRSRFGDYG